MKHATPIPDEKKKHFAKWLRNTRMAKKVSMAVLAKAAGISTSSVAHHCKEINFPHETHPHILPAYEKVLGEKWIYPPEAEPAPVTETVEKRVPFTIAIAKRRLAAEFGVTEDAIEITIRG